LTAEPFKALELFDRFAATAPTTNVRNAFLDGRSWAELQISAAGPPKDRLSSVEREIESKLSRVYQAWQEGQGIQTSHFRISDVGFALRPDRDAALERHETLVPRWCEQFPELAPFLLVLWTMEQVTTNTVAERSFRESFAQIERDNTQVADLKAYAGQFSDFWTWTLARRLGDLTVRTIRWRERLAEEGLCDPLDDRATIILAHGYLHLQDWSNALQLLEPFGYRAISMNRAGPWGDYRTPALPARLAASCREALGLSAPDSILMYASRNLVRAGGIEDFLLDGDLVWVGFSNRLARLDMAAGTKEEFTLPGHPNTRPTSLARTKNHLWIGTRNGGLLARDLTTGTIEQRSDQDGLLLNHVRALFAEGDSLWIGYAEGYQARGGLGRLDLATRRIQNFIPALPTGFEEAADRRFGPQLDSPDGPPRHGVVSIARGDSQTLWIAVARKGIQRFHTQDETWATYPAADRGNLLTALAAHNEIVLAGCETSSPATGLGPDDPGIGGLTLVRPGSRVPKHLRTADGLPNPRVTAITLDGEVAWIGGAGFVAILDLADMSFRRICPARAHTVSRIRLHQGSAWVATDRGIDVFTPEDIAGQPLPAERNQ
jgi:hypothetical protein